MDSVWLHLVGTEETGWLCFSSICDMCYVYYGRFALTLVFIVKLFYIRKTRLCNFDPLKRHFYIVKLGFIGVYIIFIISDQNIDCGRFERVPTIYVLIRNMKKYRSFLSKNFQFFEVKFSIYLNRRVFVMSNCASSKSSVLFLLTVLHLLMLK